jgi:hypothetical protein
MWRDEADAIWSSYDQSFREDTHQLLAWGYQDSLALIGPEREETEITGFIAEAIQVRLDSFEIDERFDRYSIKDDNPTPGEGRTGKRRMRIDIIIECGLRPRSKICPRYVFEAKRLRRRSHGMSTYLGDEGLLRFVHSRYAADCPEVAMVGYVQTDDSTYWVTALKEEFDNDSTGQFCVASTLTKISVIPDFVDEWTSVHTRSSGSQITICHLLLNCLSAMAKGVASAQTFS